jgi:hypothetical protein
MSGLTFVNGFPCVSFDPLQTHKVIAFKQYGWMFPQSDAYMLLIANSAGVGGDPVAIERAMLTTWDYLLGANPGGHSLFTGFGAQRMRLIVDQDSVFDGIEPPGALRGTPHLQAVSRPD